MDSNQDRSDQYGSDQCGADQCESKQCVLDQGTSDKFTSDQCVSNQDTSGQFISDQGTSDQCTSDQNIINDKQIKDLDINESNPIANQLIEEFNQYTQFKLVHNPVCLSTFQNKEKDNYFKGCKWSPDGSCLLTCSQDKLIRLFNLPTNFNSIPIDFQSSFKLDVAFQIKEGGLIYDYCFNPSLNSSNSSSCFLLTTSHGSPVHMFDAYTGHHLNSYVAYTDTEEETFAYSLTINPITNKIYAGYKNAIRFYDLNRPGRISDLLETYYEKEGQSGLITSLAINPSNTDIFAAGSYSKQLGLYSESDMKQICVILGHKGGLTNMKFSHDGTKLYSGGRKEDEIICWDIRYLSTILYSLKRDSNTNQRIYFDTNFYSNYLVSGNQNGDCSFYDLMQFDKYESSSNEAYKPTFKFKAHQDCLNGVSLHPFYPLLATCSGERKFKMLIENEDENCEFFNEKIQFDNSLKFWWLTDIQEYKDYQNLNSFNQN